MPETENLQAIVKSIVSYCRPSAVLLFGSHARGNAAMESDIDICVLYDHLPKRNLEVLQDLYRSLPVDLGRAVDLVVYEVQKFEELARRNGIFEQTIQREGQILYG